MPLTAPQLALHWRHWSAVTHANHWRMEHGRLDPRAVLEGFAGYHRKVGTFAEQIALHDHRAVTVDDLRKGAYILALGKPKSLTVFDNRDLDRVLAVLRLLADPEDLEAVLTHTAYERGEDPGARRRLLAGIRMKAPTAYIVAVCKDKFGTDKWEGLTLAQLQHLNVTLKERGDKWRRPVASSHDEEADLLPEYSSENAPF